MKAPAAILMTATKLQRHKEVHALQSILMIFNEQLPPIANMA